MALNIMRRTVQYPVEGMPILTANAQATSYEGGSITFAAAPTAMLAYAPAKPVRVVRWGVLVTTAASDNSTGTLEFQGCIYPTVGSASSAVIGSTTTVGGNSVYNASDYPTMYIDTAGGTLTVPNSQLNAGGGVAAGSVLWHNVSSQVAQTGGYYPAPDTALIPPGGVDTQLVIYPGQQFVIRCSAVGSTAGAGKFFVEIEEQPFVADYNNNAMVVTGYPSDNGTTPTPSWPFAHAAYNYQS